MSFSAEQKQLLKECVGIAQTGGVSLYLVGGLVRDLFLSHELADKDIDLVVEGNALLFAETANKTLRGQLKKFPRFYTAKIVRPEVFSGIAEVDFASAREEVYESEGALPKVKLSAIHGDLKRRDFSVNAIALPVAELVNRIAGDIELEQLEQVALDHFGGVSDIRSGTIRVLHSKSFLDDPTRMFRACRYVVRLSGEIEPESLRYLEVARDKGALSTISEFRIAREIEKIIVEERACEILKWMEQLRLIDSLNFFRLFDVTLVTQLLARAQTLPFSDDTVRKDVLLAGLLSQSKKLEESKQYFQRVGIGKRKLALYQKWGDSRSGSEKLSEQAELVQQLIAS